MTPGAWLAQYETKSERRLVGLTSGTSVDGIDVALVRLAGAGRSTRAVLEAFVVHPFPPDLRERTLAASHGNADPQALSRLHFALGALFADAAEALLRREALPLDQIDAVASHGQTVSHTPPAATLQLGAPAVIAARLGVPVVADFRAADLARGGQGAPLIPFADWCLLTVPDRSRAIQNVGGIANVTYLPPDASPEDVCGFDTGPGNMLLDRAAHWATGGALAFDRDGALAARGRLDTAALAWLLEHPFLQLAPPRSAGREEFGEGFWSRLLERWAYRHFQRREDLVTTLTWFTALSIVDAYARFLPARPAEVIVGGGGARNRFLMRLLAERLAPAPVRSHASVGIDGDAKEALAFALLANETLLGNPASLPSVTGASSPALLGAITFPARAGEGA